MSQNFLRDLFLHHKKAISEAKLEEYTGTMVSTWAVWALWGQSARCLPKTRKQCLAQSKRSLGVRRLDKCRRKPATLENTGQNWIAPAFLLGCDCMYLREKAVHLSLGRHGKSGQRWVPEHQANNLKANPSHVETRKREPRQSGPNIREPLPATILLI